MGKGKEFKMRAILNKLCCWCRECETQSEPCCWCNDEGDDHDS